MSLTTKRWPISEKVIRGATYFIKNGDKLEGILCINHDTSELVDVMTKLISLENLGNFVNILGIDAAFAEVEEAEIINKEKTRKLYRRYPL